MKRSFLCNLLTLLCAPCVAVQGVPPPALEKDPWLHAQSELVRSDGIHWNPPAMKLLAETAVHSILREPGKNPAKPKLP